MGGSAVQEHQGQGLRKVCQEVCQPSMQVRVGFRVADALTQKFQLLGWAGSVNQEKCDEV